ncbi:unnamed protein product [Rhizoctonia solani]|uniref:Uncharacterized protein n=1 Tax=Rhizoctonia solani TaxID=456999 RepID=A0A8H2ZXR7_9AGAM|nr:unnamed protein product [Rhizoctonia solani]
MMKFAAASLLAFAALAVAQGDPSINSPASVVQCQPIQLSWTATKEPVYISIIPGGQPGAAPLHDFGAQPAGTKSLTWTVNMPSGTDLTFQLRDNTGQVVYSATTPIQNSSDSSCLQGSKGGSSAPAQLAPGTTGASSSTQAPPPATTPAGTPPAGTSTSSGNASTRPPATATSVPTPSSTNAPAANGALPIAQVGWTGLMGLLAALIVA